VVPTPTSMHFRIKLRNNEPIKAGTPDHFFLQNEENRVR
jgi:hypothetical protein